MNIKSTLLAAAGVLSIVAPAAAVHADPYDGGYYGQGWQGDGDGWRDRGDWRDRDQWRDDGRWRREYAWRRYHGYGYGRRCWIENRGHYAWDGDYVYRRVRICR